jgi:alpha-galactosidase
MRRASKKHPKFIVIVARSLLMVSYGKKLKSRRPKMKYAKYSPSESNKWLNCPPSLSQSNFLDDAEKMADFEILTREEFLTSYSYLTEEEYDNTKREVNNDTA